MFNVHIVWISFLLRLLCSGPYDILHIANCLDVGDSHVTYDRAVNMTIHVNLFFMKYDQVVLSCACSE